MANQNTQEITLNQLIVLTRNNLGEISVPMKYKAQIADPIQAAIENLNVYINVMNQIQNQAKAQPEPQPVNDDHEPEIEVVEVGTVSGEELDNITPINEAQEVNTNEEDPVE